MLLIFHRNLVSSIHETNEKLPFFKQMLKQYTFPMIYIAAAEILFAITFVKQNIEFGFVWIIGCTKSFKGFLVFFNSKNQIKCKDQPM